ncbi:MAG: hypothetical protein L3J69_06300 [Desulfobacula sp.]|nr:hypothetical protein [Desulfobacula sp.]
MKRKLKSAIIIRISFVIISYLFSVLSAVSSAQDFKSDNPGELFATANISVKNMAISYHGQPSGDRPILKSKNEGSIYFTLVVDSPEAIVPATNENLTGVGKKIKELTNYVLKYVSVDNSNKDEAIPRFGSKNEIETNKEMTDEYDLNLSLNIGYDDEAQNIAISAIKLSSYFFSTHLGAVYDANEKDIDFFLSNAAINTYLLDGMKLEFQVSPANSGGAVLFTMQF